MKQQIPPALAAWSLSFPLPRVFDETIDTTRFSGVEFQFRPTTSVDEAIHTTRFSGVEFQFSPKPLQTEAETETPRR